MDRNQLQKEIAESFCELPNKKALAVLGTGFGKNKVAFHIIQMLKPERILFLVESTTNRDVTTKEEYTKWGMEQYVEITTFVTYQTAYKWKKEKVNLDNYLIIADRHNCPL